jgi:hypothetical protein
VAVAGNHDAGLGLNTDPTTDLSYTSIDYWVFWKANGFVDIYESGVLRGTFGAYAAGDRFSVHYDGVNVRYYRNGTVLRTVAATIAGALFFDSSIFQQGHGINDVRFEAQSAVRDIGTAQLQPEAATRLLIASGASGSVYADESNIIGGTSSVPLCSVTYTNNTGATVGVQVEAQAYSKLTQTGTGGRFAWFQVQGGVGAAFPQLASGVIPIAETTADYRLQAAVLNDSMAAGQTITWTLLANATVISGSTPDTTVLNEFGQSTLRVTIIKR